MTKTPIFCFDMDGTIADLYGVENWLPMIRAYDATPYREAKPLLNLSALARQLNAAQRKGAKLVIISWASKDPDPGLRRTPRPEADPRYFRPQPEQGDHDLHDPLRAGARGQVHALRAGA